MGRRNGRVALGAAVALLVALGSGAVAAAEEQGPNTGRLSLSAGVDWTTDYYFRGIVQETKDWIFQPYAEVSLKVFESQGPLSAVTVTAGLWNSLHGGPTGVEGNGPDPQAWYESDFYARLGVTLFEDLALSFQWTAYMSPNDSFDTVGEIGLGVGYDDSKLLGAFALHPSLLLAFETTGQADGGKHKGTYLQLGVSPGVTLMEKGPVPISLAFPLAVGLSLSDYYEYGTGHDDTFGFFSGGVTASVPLAFIPPAFGTWQIRGGVTFLALGGNTKDVNNNDGLEVIGTLGLALAY